GGKHSTFSLTLPISAKDIQFLSGFDEVSTHVNGSTLTNFAALNPGSTQYQIAYSIPIVDGKADLTIASPAPAQTLMIFVPDDGTVVKAQGAELAGSTDMGNGKTRFYKATEVALGQQVTFALSGIVETTKPAASSGLSSAHLAQIVAGSGAAIILLFGIAFIFIKGTPKKTQSA
ncbi:MAG TPA: hypothetical protein VHD56_18050, partial [Tepidisphaeraceae bacterium]|nr:hypothetical protein [Tepidisphaeraceae bacterium]